MVSKQSQKLQTKTGDPTKWLNHRNDDYYSNDSNFNRIAAALIISITRRSLDALMSRWPWQGATKEDIEVGHMLWSIQMLLISMQILDNVLNDDMRESLAKEFAIVFSESYISLWGKADGISEVINASEHMTIFGDVALGEPLMKLFDVMDTMEIWINSEKFRNLWEKTLGLIAMILEDIYMRTEATEDFVKSALKQYGASIDGLWETK